MKSMKSNDKISIIFIILGVAIILVNLPGMIDYVNYKYLGKNPIDSPWQKSRQIEDADRIIRSCSEKLELDSDKTELMESCINSGDKDSILNEDQELVKKYGVRGVPGFVVGCSYLFAGAYSPGFMSQVIELASLATIDEGDGNGDAVSNGVLNSTELRNWCLMRATNKTCTLYVSVVGDQICKKDDRILVQEFLDMTCPECNRAQDITVPWLKNNRNIAFEQHHAVHSEKSERLAEAIECAGDLGMRDEFTDCIFGELFPKIFPGL